MYCITGYNLDQSLQIKVKSTHLIRLGVPLLPTNLITYSLTQLGLATAPQFIQVTCTCTCDLDVYLLSSFRVQLSQINM